MAERMPTTQVQATKTGDISATNATVKVITTQIFYPGALHEATNPASNTESNGPQPYICDSCKCQNSGIYLHYTCKECTRITCCFTCYDKWDHKKTNHRMAMNGKKFNEKKNLFKSARDGNLEVVIGFIEEAKVDLESKDTNSRTALHLACSNGQNKVAQYLLRKGASVNATDKTGFTPLHLASEGGHPETVWILLINRANIEAKNALFRTPLHWASRYGHKDVVELLLVKGADWNARDQTNFTPLHFACGGNYSFITKRASDQGIVQLLLDRGAAIDAKDENQWTPLLNAAYQGHQAIVELLLDRGADIDSEGIVPQGSWDPRRRIIKKGFNETVELFMSKGVSTDPNDENKCTAIHVAFIQGHQDIVDLLITRGAKITKPQYIVEAINSYKRGFCIVM